MTAKELSNARPTDEAIRSGRVSRRASWLASAAAGLAAASVAVAAQGMGQARGAADSADALATILVAPDGGAEEIEAAGRVAMPEAGFARRFNFSGLGSFALLAAAIALATTASLGRRLFAAAEGAGAGLFARRDWPAPDGAAARCLGRSGQALRSLRRLVTVTAAIAAMLAAFVGAIAPTPDPIIGAGFLSLVTLALLATRGLARKSAR